MAKMKELCRKHERFNTVGKNPQWASQEVQSIPQFFQKQNMTGGQQQQPTDHNQGPNWYHWLIRDEGITSNFPASMHRYDGCRPRKTPQLRKKHRASRLAFSRAHLNQNNSFWSSVHGSGNIMLRSCFSASGTGNFIIIPGIINMRIISRSSMKTWKCMLRISSLVQIGRTSRTVHQSIPPW